jgi:putative membrane-bound dehydrogenase-like protein
MTATRLCRFACLPCLIAAALALLPRGDAQPPPRDAPRSHDPRLVVELFAAAPDIVHPIGLDFDHKGRLLVIESHTHFPPRGYKGPRHDRIRILEDTDGDGKADKFTIFFEGTRATMDIAVHPDGSVYLATRNEILRLRDTKGTGKADERTRLVFLDTKGDYPHNGLSGLAFDEAGNLLFGMGENLGARYKLTGADGTTIADEGEGGNVFWCTADGKGLRRVATGFWNPFGVCRDVFGRTFAVDNDPDAMPPCRLVHVVEGADFGFQFRYGRSGRHPFQSWNGQLPGTLPMASGTGEAPCEVVSYESDGLPREYLGNLLVASWADHRIERYVLKERGASWEAERKPFITGGKDFRPVGIAVAPDGSLFVSDWVLSNYELHGKGAIWHIRWKDGPKPERPRGTQWALFSAHRPLREAAARTLVARGPNDRSFAYRGLINKDVRVRATCLAVFLKEGPEALNAKDLRDLAGVEPVPAMRAMLVRALVARGEDATAFLDRKHPPAVRFEAIGSLRDPNRLLALLTDTDPYLRHAAVRQLARSPKLLADLTARKLTDPRQRIGVLLAQRESGLPEAAGLVPRFLADPDEEVRFLAAKWVADRRLTQHRGLLVDRLKDPKLSVRLFFAYTTAVARIDRKDVSEAGMADHFLARLADPQTLPAVRVMALRMVPPGHPKLTFPLLTGLLSSEDPAVRLETVRLLSEIAIATRVKVLLGVARDRRQPAHLRAEALVGVADHADKMIEVLLRFARDDSPPVRDEAVRALTNVKLTAEHRAELEGVARKHPGVRDLVARALGKPFTAGRPPHDDIAAWLKRLDGPGDAAAGRRVFFHPRLGGCFRCHRVDGRGRDVGPDLSGIGRAERRNVLESILKPSNLVAPHYQAWVITTADGRVRSGMLMHTHLDECTYVDPQGDQFRVNTRDITDARPARTSIMPDGLADLFTDQELRDLLAYLGSRR